MNPWMSRGLIVVAAFLSSGCSEKVDVPAGKIGLVVRFGEVRAHVVGPSSIEKRMFLDTVVKIDKEAQVSVGDVSVTYVVEDPAAYFYYFRGEPEAFARILGRELSKSHPESEDAVVSRFVKRIGAPVRVVEIKRRQRDDGQ